MMMSSRNTPYSAYPSYTQTALPEEQPFILIAGPCVMEQEGELNRQTARELHRIVQRFGSTVRFYFKSSFDKANRTSNGSYRGVSLQKGLDVFRSIKEELGCPVLTDIHSPEQAHAVADVVDMLQIPAFLCRQTDLLVAAGETGKAVNIKKGQFLSPLEVQYCAQKVKDTGNHNVYITERGTTFGYNNLVVDMRSVPQVHSLGLPLIFDATHSVQQPGGLQGKSGGDRQFAPVLARCAVAAGCDGLFFETHPDPNVALSDGPNQLPLAWVEPFLEECLGLRAFLQKKPLSV
jgi:2-dehydro-3-deoxyphosphooctonate aldolase (KDO 8-P synthase)